MTAHPIPAAALEEDIAAVGQKGAGKSYTTRGLVERLLDDGRRTIVLDPMNSWWGLKARADGSPGYPVAVVGGDHADVPLNPDAGAALGEYLAGSTLSAVVDVADLEKRDLVRFATDFLGELYRRNRDPLWLVLEEADVFAPQNPSTDGTRRMHDVVDQIARRGRAFGFRLWTITQRPARLSKDVLGQASTLVAMRLGLPHDRKAIAEWVKGNTDPAHAQQLLDALPSLPIGEGMVWAPRLELMRQVKFPRIATLDTSATPKAGERRRKAGALASADVDQLKAALALQPPPIDDEGAAVRHATAAESMPPTERAFTGATVQQLVDRARAEGDAVGYQRGLTESFARHHAHLCDVQDRILALAHTILVDRDAIAPPAAQEPPPSPSVAPAPPVKPAKRPKPSAAPKSTPGDGISTAAEAMLAAALAAPRQVDWPEAALLAGFVPGGGYFNNLRKQLADAGHANPPAPIGGARLAHSAEDLWQLFAGKLKRKGAAADRVFNHLWVTGPQSRDQVAQGLGIAAGGGFWNHTWKIVRGHVLFTETPKGWDIAPILRELKEARRP